MRALGILGQKKQSLPYANSNLITQTKTDVEPKENELSGHQSNKSKTSVMMLGKPPNIATRNGSQSRQPRVAAATTHSNVAQGTSTNNRIA